MKPETLAALRNMGHDVTCGACMEVAFTGVTLAAHTCRTVEQPAETEEQVAERELGAWLVAHPNATWVPRSTGNSHRVDLYERAWESSSSFGEGRTRAAAIREALRLAKETDNAD